MEINLNGKKLTSNSLTLMDLVLEQGFKPESLIAEVNFEVVRQETWKHVSLSDGDTIELLSFVGGG
ncbi:sulfur carrier protein ThiS [Desulfobacula toluolica]|uniref:ThiS: thiazole biosynthesis protein n=1 Tax=Desulfobacula toluolica (strain DSM 7467 / Tol2) TaxID=651182 RepID=K0NBY5_DESTT|nr:sulfur carrier protein ThiS [Desulfobacula toluolica]CCK78231.1 ThiS: thiazole biosynthesis protein [Desulfobacula toluolica Tol2]